MTITKERKKELIEEYKVGEADTGSSDVQVAVLTSADAEEIISLDDGGWPE